MKFKIITLICLAVLSLKAVAQTTTPDTARTSEAGSAKIFGGAAQYNTWSIGVNAGLTSDQIPFFNNLTNHYVAALGYGATLRDQLSHVVSLQLDYYGGTVKGSDQADSHSGASTSKFGVTYLSTSINEISLSGVAAIGCINFLHRQNGIILYASAGLGLDFYKPSNSSVLGATASDKFATHSIKELAAPVGSGVKFRLSDNFALNVGYTMTFIQGYNFSGLSSFPFHDHYAYTYAGLEYTFGVKTKSNIEWVNPVAVMYDELYDEALRQEVAALKVRVGNVETAVNDLKKDSDGDGVSDQFDKCPNTPAGTAVDGSGCPLPAPIDTSLFMRKGAPMMNNGNMAPAQAYTNIQFEFDSSVLKTESYPILDMTSADLKSSGAVCELDGFASSEGTAAHNMRLSKDRANSVKTYLVNSGVSSKKLKVKAFGETHPIADNSTEEGRIKNRRVEFKKK